MTVLTTATALSFFVPYFYRNLESAKFGVGGDVSGKKP
jgi:hypothetical protein